MKTKQSAGILLYRIKSSAEIFLVHPGGPFWKNKDEGSWTIPKGEIGESEDALDAASREFEEETGYRPSGDFQQLETIVQKAGKRVQAWAIAGDFDAATMRSNLVELEWPKGSGRKIKFPEVDRGQWFGLDAARKKINPAQVSFIDQFALLVATQYHK